MATFQSTPVIANGRIQASVGSWPTSASCFNPRPLLLTGESSSSESTRRAHKTFQSTPVIANGRIFRCSLMQCGMGSFNPRPLLLTGESTGACLGVGGDVLFQSTPVIANGRIHQLLVSARHARGFNPRPLLLTGESFLHLTKVALVVVSIHARYC